MNFNAGNTPVAAPHLPISEMPRTAIISTAHVSQADQEIIAGLCWSNDTERGEHWIMSTKYGWVFCLDRCSSWEKDLAKFGINEKVILNLKYVQSCGFEWVNFEVCGSVIDELFQWVW